MALYWVVCDVIGNGSAPRPNQTALTGPFRPSVDGLGPYRCLIVDGISWCLVSIDGDPLALAAVPGAEVLPDERLDVVLTQQRANQANNALGRRGLPEVAEAGMTYRQLIETIASTLDPTFTTDWYPGVT
jgi:hypothetical protein